MNTGTAATRARVREAWTPVLAASGAQGQQLGGQILAVAHQLARGRLRGPLTDPAREPQDKADLATRLLSGKVDERVVELVCAMVRGRWSKPVDIISALHDLGIEAILVGAHADGSVGDIEQELFAVAEYLDRDRELRQGLEPSRRVTTEERVRLAERVFAAHICAPASCRKSMPTARSTAAARRAISAACRTDGSATATASAWVPPPLNSTSTAACRR